MRGRGDQLRTQYEAVPHASEHAEFGRSSAAPVQPMEIVSPDLGGMAQLDRRKPTGKKVSKPGNGGDALVFIAMGLVSAALGLGLYAHVGIDLPVALIASLGLFVSTSFLHVFVRRMQGVDLLDRRVSALEETVYRVDDNGEANLASQPTRVQDSEPAAVEPTHSGMDPGLLHVPGDPAQLAESDEIQGAGLESVVPAPTPELAELPPAYQIPQDAAVGFGADREPRTSSISEPIYDLTRPANADYEARGEFNAPSGGRSNVAMGESPQHEGRSIDGLVKQLSEGMSGTSDRHAARDARLDGQGQSARDFSEPSAFGQRENVPSSRREAGETPLISMPQKAARDTFDPIQTEMPISGAVSSGQETASDPVGKAIQAAARSGSVEIYLQPILSIEDRKVRFFEVLGRVQGPEGEVIAAEDHIDLARSVGASNGLDRAILTRAGRLLRKLSERRQAQPLFCNISRDTLADGSFQRNFAELVSGYRDIAPYLVFEVDHAAIIAADNTTIGNLRALGSMGFRISIDNVTNVEQALANGRELDASFIKLAYDVFMPMQLNQAEARSRAATIQSVARDSGMTLIVDRIERKDQLAGAVSAGATLGQGYLFSEPKPLLPQVAAEVAEDTAAA